MAYKLAGKIKRSADMIVVCNFNDGSLIQKLENLIGGNEWSITGLSSNDPVLIFSVFSNGSVEGYGKVVPVSE